MTIDDDVIDINESGSEEIFDRFFLVVSPVFDMQTSGIDR
jgi:hypothetical protein